MHRLQTVIFGIATAVAVGVAMPQTAVAQVGHPGAIGQPWASPYQQRLSPYLDLLRNDNSILSPYHTFVQPRRRVQQSLNQQSAQIGRLQQQVLSGSAANRSRGQERLPTGRGGTFNNYLHYYRIDQPLRTK